ncbi:MAG TPA: AmmeMemoRadiSam system radical SAM enzyme [Streptosporangiaceae bacterium]|nr:AmmeMemoRadiSam system radical SAM enzyme [Streptosporangiaceae bacterium]
MPTDVRDHEWQNEAHSARLWSPDDNGGVICHLSPRNCKIRDGKVGFCRVRVNRGGQLYTLNYGKSVAATEETIETEAVYHFAPGARILSMGNIGCMMNCDYCHNWQTSQARFVGDGSVYYYTPEQVVEECLSRNIKIISWTYNDPVVWQEFVIDTARIAKQEGLINLYKSAFYISEPAIDQLLEVIDIFSISLKSMDPIFYKRVTKGQLPPVLDGIRQVYRSGRHLELSMLLVTDSNDMPGEPEKVSRFILDELDDQVPLHYVRFHPDYKYTHVTRTPIDRLERARAAALEMGMKYVYLGNVYDNPAVNTYCPACGQTAVERYGLRAVLSGLDDSARCTGCGHQVPLKMPLLGRSTTVSDEAREVLAAGTARPFDWHGDIKALHVEVANGGKRDLTVVAVSRGGVSAGEILRAVSLRPGSRHRFMLSKSVPDQTGVAVVAAPDVQVEMYEVFDRAHFPIMSTAEVNHSSDAVPQPAFIGMPFANDRPERGSRA